jgi:hypothetical protein
MVPQYLQISSPCGSIGAHLASFRSQALIGGWLAMPVGADVFLGRQVLIYQGGELVPQAPCLNAPLLLLA